MRFLVQIVFPPFVNPLPLYFKYLEDVSVEENYKLCSFRVRMNEEGFIDNAN